MITLAIEQAEFAWFLDLAEMSFEAFTDCQRILSGEDRTATDANSRIDHSTK